MCASVVGIGIANGCSPMFDAHQYLRTEQTSEQRFVEAAGLGKFAAIA
jgi:hypothetical protein